MNRRPIESRGPNSQSLDSWIVARELESGTPTVEGERKGSNVSDAFQPHARGPLDPHPPTPGRSSVMTFCRVFFVRRGCERRGRMKGATSFPILSDKRERKREKERVKVIFTQTIRRTQDGPTLCLLHRLRISCLPFSFSSLSSSVLVGLDVYCTTLPCCSIYSLNRLVLKRRSTSFSSSFQSFPAGVFFILAFHIFFPSSLPFSLPPIHTHTQRHTQQAF